MLLSDRLFSKVEALWKEASHKPFVTEMAKGTLEEKRFCYYMIQDYLYLQDYIDLLYRTLGYAEDPNLKGFLQDVIEETKKEAERVHIKYFIKKENKSASVENKSANPSKVPVIIDYVGYMRQQLEAQGLLAGLTALLQCSWVYAYIGQTATSRYGEDIQKSPYKDWFDAYTSREYLEANKAWIDVLNRMTEDISQDEADKLCEIFTTCAQYENRFWDIL